LFGSQKEHYESGTMTEGNYETVLDLMAEYGGSIPTGGYFGMTSVTSDSDTGSQCVSFMVQSMQITTTFNSTAEFDPGQSFSLTFNVSDSGAAVENATVEVDLINPRVGIVSSLSNMTNASGIYVLTSTAPADEGTYVYLVSITHDSDEAMDEVPFRVRGNTATVVLLDSNGNYRNIFSSEENATIRVNITNSAGSPASASVKLKIFDTRATPVYTDNSYLVNQSRDLSYNVTGLSGWYYVNVYTASDAEIGSGALKVIA
jgi:hypothetical protein